MEDREGIVRAHLFSGQPTTTEEYRHCTPFKLPSNGVIRISPDTTITLAADALFTPECSTPEQSQLNADDAGGVMSIADMRDPFHASITPQAYATGAATVIAWMLVIMLIITPRTFFVGGTSGRSGLMGRRGMISGSTGGGSVIGVGTRPWLQKVAALTVAISLTLATADTFKIAERQYEEGFMDAMKLRDEVVSGMEIKVSRVISDVFIWLAQVQTLIRLFPRHKEKVIIKWTGFALILLDITFSSLNSFGPYNDKERPRHFETAVPALSYLFQLSLSMLYAAWVMYYAVTKRRYAFYHSMMWNISLVALLSIIAILTPVVFFIIDISNYTIAGWGDYFRWVGAAAASVIVWEWVERIEALEREERKDGILGREIYDGDEMLDTTPSHEVRWPRPHRQNVMPDSDPNKPGDPENGNGGVFTSGSVGHTFGNIAHRLGRSRNHPQPQEPQNRRSIHITAPAPVRRSDSGQSAAPNSRTCVPSPVSPSPVPVVASPVSRTDTTSADSTVYTIQYHPVSESPPNVRRPVSIGDRNGTVAPIMEVQNSSSQPSMGDQEESPGIITNSVDANDLQTRGRWNWPAVSNPFQRRVRSPPPEVQRGRVIEPLGIGDVSANIPPRNYTGFALKDRLGTFAAQQGERFRSKRNVAQQAELDLPVTIIPAQPRGRTWSPEILYQEGASTSAVIHPTRDPPHSVATVMEGSDLSTLQPRGPLQFNERSSPASSFNRNSNVRPGTNAMQQAETESTASAGPRVASSVTDMQRPPLATPEPSDPRSRSAINVPQTPTNHDR